MNVDSWPRIQPFFNIFVAGYAWYRLRGEYNYRNNCENARALFIRTCVRTALAAAGLFAIYHFSLALAPPVFILGAVISGPSAALAAGACLCKASPALIINALFTGSMASLFKGGMMALCGLFMLRVHPLFPGLIDRYILDQICTDPERRNPVPPIDWPSRPSNWQDYIPSRFPLAPQPLHDLVRGGIDWFRLSKYAYPNPDYGIARVLFIRAAVRTTTAALGALAVYTLSLHLAPSIVLGVCISLPSTLLAGSSLLIAKALVYGSFGFPNMALGAVGIVLGHAISHLHSRPQLGVGLLETVLDRTCPYDYNRLGAFPNIRIPPPLPEEA